MNRSNALWITLLGHIGGWALRILGMTWRVRTEGTDPRTTESNAAHIGALWHRDILLAGYFFRDSSIAIPVSQSGDGDLAAAILQSLGFAPSPRGSSSRGGTAVVRELIQHVQGGGIAAIMTDGPRGPAGSSKAGIITLADKSKTPITPVCFSARPCVRLASWDRTLIPLPFARVVCRFGDPILTGTLSTPEERESARREVERQQQRITRDLDQAVGNRLEETI